MIYMSQWMLLDKLVTKLFLLVSLLIITIDQRYIM